MKNRIFVKHTIRFRRWSRKSYAVFASLGCCVTIGCVCNSIANKSLPKHKATEQVYYKNQTEIIETPLVKHGAPQWPHPLLMMIRASYLSMNLIADADDNNK